MEADVLKGAVGVLLLILILFTENLEMSNPIFTAFPITFL